MKSNLWIIDTWLLPSLFSPKTDMPSFFPTPLSMTEWLFLQTKQICLAVGPITYSKHKVKMNATTLATSAKSGSIVPFTVLIHNDQILLQKKKPQGKDKCQRNESWEEIRDSAPLKVMFLGRRVFHALLPCFTINWWKMFFSKSQQYSLLI